MLYVKGGTIPELTVELVRRLRLPEGLRRSQRIGARALSGAPRARHAPLAALPVRGANSSGNYTHLPSDLGICASHIEPNDGSQFARGFVRQLHNQLPAGLGKLQRLFLIGE